MLTGKALFAHQWIVRSSVLSDRNVALTWDCSRKLQGTGYPDDTKTRWSLYTGSLGLIGKSKCPSRHMDSHIAFSSNQTSLEATLPVTFRPSIHESQSLATLAFRQEGFRKTLCALVGFHPNNVLLSSRQHHYYLAGAAARASMNGPTQRTGSAAEAPHPITPSHPAQNPPHNASSRFTYLTASPHLWMG